MKDAEEQHEYQEEADELRLLDRQDQADIVRMHRTLASDPMLWPQERQAAFERAEALSRLLDLDEGHDGPSV
jgi:hypothetical protein